MRNTVAVELPREQVPRLQLLLGSKVLDAAVAEADKQRAAEKAALLKETAEQREAYEAEIVKRNAKIAKLLPRRAAALAVLAAVDDEIAAEDLGRYAAQHGLTRLEGRHRSKLMPLGGAVIEETFFHLCVRERDVAGTLSWRPVYHSFNVGQEIDTVKVNGDAHDFYARVKALRLEVDALWHSDLPPHEVERRCREAMAEADGGPTLARPEGPKAYVAPPRGIGAGA